MSYHRLAGLHLGMYASTLSCIPPLAVRHRTLSAPHRQARACVLTTRGSPRPPGTIPGSRFLSCRSAATRTLPKPHLHTPLPPLCAGFVAAAGAEIFGSGSVLSQLSAAPQVVLVLMGLVVASSIIPIYKVRSSALHRS